MKLLVGTACVAIIAATGYYFAGEYAAHAALIERQKVAIETASVNDCKSAIFDAFMQSGYQGDDIKKATVTTLKSDRCMIQYPQLESYHQGSALETVQQRARLSQLRAAAN